MLRRCTCALALLLGSGRIAHAEKIPLHPPKGAVESEKRPERTIVVGDKRPILVMLEGSDMAGKSSTIRRILRALGNARTVGQAHWLAPTEQEKAEPLLARYLRKLPADNTIMIWDRSWYGDAVHPVVQGTIDPPEMHRRLVAINEQEAELAKAYKIVKIFLDTSLERVNQTLTKRQTQAPGRLTDADALAAANHGKVRDVYRLVVQGSDEVAPWKVIDMSDRHAGRDHVVDYLEQALTPMPEPGSVVPARAP
jgi:polyphosphate kinase 2 (PPK2 family)